MTCVFSLCFSGSNAYANPEGGVVAAGNATITPSGNTLNIHQTSNKAIIDWRSFDIAPNETTRFYQPSSSSMTLNRVNSNDPSKILGTMTANGHVVIVNPNGVFFGKGSQVDVGGLTATTANIRNSDFINGQMKFDQAGNSQGIIINEGSITARDQGLVNLVGPQVENHGVIQATLGTVNLASGEKFTLDLANDGLLEVTVDKDVLPKQAITNTGKISANGGRIHITAAAARHVVDSLITNTGVIEAKTLGMNKGSVILSAQGKNAVKNNVAADKNKLSGNSGVVNSGTIDVSGTAKGEQGGTASLLADTVWLESGSKIDASGSSGGGKVKVGGDYYGAGDTPTALVTYAAKNTFIKADAIDQGDGGNITVWSDGSTHFYGDISAQGGDVSGDGGFVEVSGKQHLNYRGHVDTTAANGQTGMLLLDPADIVIMNGTGDSGSDGTATFRGNATAGTIVAGDAGPSILYESELEGIAAATNISVAATNSILVNDLTTDGTLSLKQTSGRTVTFTTGAGGFTMANTANTIATAGGALTITATGGGVILGNLATAGGLITLNVGAASSVNGVISGTNTALTKSGTGVLTLSGLNTYTGRTTIAGGTLSVSNLADGGIASNIGQSASTAANLTFSGGRLQYTGSSTSINRGYVLTASTSNTIDITSAGTDLTLTGASTATSGALIKDGAGTLTFGAANLYTGLTTITDGTLAYGITNALASGAVNVAGGTLDIGVFNDTVGVVTLTSGTITGSTGILRGTSFAVQSGTISANIDGAGALTKTTTGLVTLSGTNTYTGASVVSAGTLRATNASALGAGNLTLSGGTLELASDSNINFGRNTTVTANSNIVIDRITSGAAVTHTLGTLSQGAFTLTLSAGGNATSGTSGLNFGATTITGHAILGTGAGTQLSLGALSDNNGVRNVTKSGLGTLRTTAASSNWTRANTITVTDGTLRLGASDSFGTGTTSSFTVNAMTANQTALFDLNGYNQGIRDLNLASTGAGANTTNNVTTGLGTLTLGGNITYSIFGHTNGATISGLINLAAGNRIINTGNSTNAVNDLTISAIISGAGAIHFNGSGRVSLSGSNTYTGGTTIIDGTVQVLNSRSLSTGNLNLGNGAGSGNRVLEIISDTDLNLGINTTLLGYGSTIILSDRLTPGAAINQTLGTYTTSGGYTLSTSHGSNVTSGVSEITFGAVTSLGTFQVNTGLNTQLNIGSLSDNNTTGNFFKRGLGTLKITAPVTQWGTGHGIVIEEGTIQGGANNFLGMPGQAPSLYFNYYANGNATFASLDLNGYNQTFSATYFGDGASPMSINSISTGSGVFTSTGPINVTNGQSTSISGNLNATSFNISPSYNLTVSANINSSSLSKVGGGALTLSGVNTNLVTANVSGGALVLAGGSTIADTGTVNLLNTSGVTLEVTADERIGTLTGGGTTGGNIILNGANLTLGNASNITYGGIISGTGGIIKTGSGIMTLSTAHTYTGDTVVSQGTLRLGAANRISDLSDLIVESSGIFDFAGFSETLNSITSDGTVLFGSGATSTTNGSQIYNGRVTTTGAVNLVSTAGGNISATNNTNDFFGNVSSSTSGAVTLVDANALALGTISANRISAAALGGNLIVNGALTASATSGTGITVSASGNFINNAGIFALQTGAGSRWLVYSASPLSDTRGGLVSEFKQYNANTSSTVLGSGNGYLYTLAPTVSVGLTGTVTKTYDGTTTADLSGVSYTSATGIDGDTVTVQSASSAVFNNANAGTGKTVTASGLTTIGSNGAVTVYGYQITGGTLSANIGTINRANITISTSDVVRDYNGTLAAAGVATVTSGTLYANASNGGVVDSLSGGSFGFTNSNAGTNKTVTVGGVTVNDGNGGGNYTVTYADNTSSTINKANLTVSTSDVIRDYNGTLAAAGVATVTSGTLYANASNGGTTDTLSGGTYAFTDANAGINKTVTVSGVTVNDGNSGDNYTVTYADNTNSTINRANLTVSTSNVVRDYDGTLNASGSAIVTSGTLYANASNGGVSDSLSGGTYAFTDANAGTNKTVTVSGVTIDDGNGGNNYNLTFADNTASTISRAALTISVGDISRVYDGTLNATGSAIITGGTLYANASNGGVVDSISGGSFGFVNANAGTNKIVTVNGVTVSDGNSGDNYTVTYADNTTSTITQANLTLSTSDVTKFYDGTTFAAGSPIVTSGTLYANVSNSGLMDNLTGGTFDFTDPNVGTGKTVQVSNVTVDDGNGGGNYFVTYANNLNSSILESIIPPASGIDEALLNLIGNTVTFVSNKTIYATKQNENYIANYNVTYFNQNAQAPLNIKAFSCTRSVSKMIGNTNFLFSNRKSIITNNSPSYGASYCS